MATTVRAQHQTGSGYDVLLEVSGIPITVTFYGGQPTEAALAERIVELEQQLLAEVVAEQINEQEEPDGLLEQ